jgi:hypothetical protein
MSPCPACSGSRRGRCHPNRPRCERFRDEEGNLIRNMVPVGPVREFVASLGMGYQAIGERLALVCGGTAGRWRVWVESLMEQERQTSIGFARVDALCVAFGTHLSRFDPLYRFYDDKVSA